MGCVQGTNFVKAAFGLRVRQYSDCCAAHKAYVPPSEFGWLFAAWSSMTRKEFEVLAEMAKTN